MLALYVAVEMRGAADVARNVGLARVERDEDANRQAGEFFANHLYGGNKIAVAAHYKRFVIFVFVGEGQKVYCKIDVRFLFLVAHILLLAILAPQVFFLEFPQDGLDAEMLLRLDEDFVTGNFVNIPVRERCKIEYFIENISLENEVLRQFSVVHPFAVGGMASAQDVVEIEAVDETGYPRHGGSIKKVASRKGIPPSVIPAPLWSGSGGRIQPGI